MVCAAAWLALWQAMFSSVVGAAGGGILYVSPAGQDQANLCTSSASPCATLQHAVNMASSGDEIRLAEGEYNQITVTHEVTQLAYIAKNLTLVGGYPADFSQPPDPENHPTVLSAQELGRVLFISDTFELVAEGLIFTLGNSKLEGFNQRGGAIFADRAVLTVRNCRFENNLAEYGGGVYGRESTLLIQNSMFENNTAGYGGAMYVQSSTITLENSHFLSNTVDLGGGALRFYAVDGQISHNSFLSNTAETHGGAIYASFGTLQFTHNELAYNTLTTTQQSWGGAVHLHSQQDTLFAYGVLAYNTADTGGGLRIDGGQVHLAQLALVGNQARTAGAMAIENGAQVSLDNVAMVDNQVTESAAGLWLRSAQAILQHTTIARNSGGAGQGILLQESDSHLTITHSLIADQLVGVENDSLTGVAEVAFTLWDNNGQNSVGTVGNTSPFAGPAGLEANDYHLIQSSAAVDAIAHSPLTQDIDGSLRPVGSGFDLGADEWGLALVRWEADLAGVAVGDEVQYTFAVTNPLDISLTLQLTHTIPAVISPTGSVTSTQGSANLTASTLTWSTTLLPHQAAELAWSGTVESFSGSTIPHTAVYWANGETQTVHLSLTRLYQLFFAVAE